MEKLEQQKKLEKKKAYVTVLIVLLGLSIPTALSLSNKIGVSVSLQASIFFVILFAMAFLYLRIQRLEARINNLLSKGS